MNIVIALEQVESSQVNVESLLDTLVLTEVRDRVAAGHNAIPVRPHTASNGGGRSSESSASGFGQCSAGFHRDTITF